MGGGGGGGRKQQQPRFDVVKLRVVAYTVPVRPFAEPRIVPATASPQTLHYSQVTHDVEPASEEICRLPRGTVVEAVEEKASRNGTVRVLITDPIWKGWISLRAPNGEPLALSPSTAPTPALSLQVDELDPAPAHRS